MPPMYRRYVDDRDIICESKTTILHVHSGSTGWPRKVSHFH